MKDNFNICLEETLKWEGGYTNHPLDPGGPTNLGIIQERYDQYNKDLGRPQKSVKGITKDEAIDIYRKYYWNAVDGDNLPSGMDLAVFDFGVNSGPSRANNALAKYKDINSYMNERERFLKSLRTFPTFGKGWLRRTAGIRKKALQMAGTYTLTDIKNTIQGQSSKLSVLKTARNAVIATSVIGGGALNLDTLTTMTTVSAQLKTFLGDHWVGLAIAGIASFWFLLKWLEYKHLIDFRKVVTFLLVQYKGVHKMLSLLGLPSLITPFLSAGLSFAGWYLKELWEGLKDIFDNLSTILCVATLVALALAYGYSSKACSKVSFHDSIPSGKIWIDPFKNDGG